MRKYRLRILIPLLLFFVSVIAILYLTADRINHYNNNVLNYERNSLAKVMSQLRETLSTRIPENNLSVARHSFSSVALDPNIISLMLVDERDWIIIANRREVINKSAAAVPEFNKTIADAVRKNQGNRILENRADMTLQGYYAVTLGIKSGELRANRIGVLWVVYNTAPRYVEARNEAVRDAFRLCSFFFIIALALAIALDALVAQRIESLLRVVEKIQGGDLTARADVGGGDEIGRLARSFDEMTRRLAESQDVLRESEHRYRFLFESATDGIVMADVETKKFRYANPAICAMLGYTEEELTKLGVADIHPKEELAHVIAEFEAQSRGEKTLAMYIPCLRKDGTVIFADVNANADEFYGKTYQIGFFRDVTKRRKAELDLKATQARLLETQRVARIGTYHFEIAQNWWTSSPVLDEIFGIDADYEKTFESWGRIVHPEQSEEMARYFGEAVKNKRFEKEYRIIRQNDGQERRVLGYGEFLFDDAGNPLFMYGTIQDVTEIRRAEDEILKLRKIESIGLLAGGIAHDFNNLLAAILGSVDFAGDVLTQDPIEAKEALSIAKKAVYDARNLTQQLLTFSKGGAPIIKTASIAPLLTETCGFVLRGSSSRAECSVPDDLWNARMDAGQISQVIQNLIINADQAMPDGGVIRVEAANRVADDQNPVAVLPNGNYVEVRVQDSGVGIPVEHLARVFDPYFTTKKRGHGLGLAMVYSIISKHNGNIIVESKPGKGTTFTFWIPATVEAADETTAATGAAKRTSRLSVLLMDDNDYIRDITRKSLIRQGYDIAVAEDGDEAVRIYASARDAGKPFDLVILDLTVPGGTGGVQTLKMLRELNPGVKAIVASGYADDPVMADHKAHGFNGMVVKPFDNDNLFNVIEEVAGL